MCLVASPPLGAKPSHPSHDAVPSTAWTELPLDSKAAWPAAVATGTALERRTHITLPSLPIGGGSPGAGNPAPKNLGHGALAAEEEGHLEMEPSSRRATIVAAVASS